MGGGQSAREQFAERVRIMEERKKEERIDQYFADLESELIKDIPHIREYLLNTVFIPTNINRIERKVENRDGCVYEVCWSVTEEVVSKYRRELSQFGATRLERIIGAIVNSLGRDGVFKIVYLKQNDVYTVRVGYQTQCLVEGAVWTVIRTMASDYLKCLISSEYRRRIEKFTKGVCKQMYTLAEELLKKEALKKQFIDEKFNEWLREKDN